MPQRKQKFPNITHLLSWKYIFFSFLNLYDFQSRKQTPDDADTVSAFKLQKLLMYEFVGRK